MKIKKLIASVLSVTAAVGMMGFSTMAADTTTNITINGNAGQYKAYRLMDVEQTLKGTCSHAEGEHTNDCYDWVYTENEKYADVITAAKQAAAGVTPPMAQFLNYPTDEFLREMQSTNMEAFEKKAWESLKTMEADAVSTTGTFENVPTGWYLIAETENGDSPDYYSLHMVDTAGKDGLTINSKEEIFTFSSFTASKKEVKVGDTVNYMIQYNLPLNVFSYMDGGRFGTYTMTFHNITAPGVELDLTNDNIRVVYSSQALQNSRDLTSSKYRTLSVGADGNSFDLTQVLENNATDAYKDGGTLTIQGTDIVKVYFSGVVKDASAFSKWVSEAWVSFPNNPYDLSETDDSPHKKLGLFNYTLDIHPVDKAGFDMSGVEYTLEKKNGESWETIDSASMGGVISFEELTSGDYRLSETKTPEGFGKHDDILFTIAPEYEGHELKSLAVMVNGEDAAAGENPLFRVDTNNGVIRTIFEYGRTTQLPSTGATSLVILLGLGALLVAAGMTDAMRRRNRA